MQKWQYTAPSGITVTSNVPLPEDKWWDNPSKHALWSRLSWATMILKTRGVKWPHKMFRKYLSR